MQFPLSSHAQRTKQNIVLLTDGNASMGTSTFDVGLGDRSHAELVKGPSEEGSKSARKGDRTSPASTANSHTHLHSEGT